MAFSLFNSHFEEHFNMKSVARSSSKAKLRDRELAAFYDELVRQGVMEREKDSPRRDVRDQEHVVSIPGGLL